MNQRQVKSLVEKEYYFTISFGEGTVTLSRQSEKLVDNKWVDYLESYTFNGDSVLEFNKWWAGIKRDIAQRAREHNRMMFNNFMLMQNPKSNN